MPSAIIVRAHLPSRLEALRRRSVPDAANGVPAHLTMLYPFMDVAALNQEVRRAIAVVAQRHRPISYRMTGPHRWPDTVYVGVEPEAPFVTLQADLAAAFPPYPIYGRPAGFVFVPHITVAEGAAADDRRTLDDPGWTSVAVDAVGRRLELIASDGGRWERIWSLPLGGHVWRRRR